MYIRRISQDTPCRFDAVGIMGESIQWIQDAFKRIDQRYRGECSMIQWKYKNSAKVLTTREKGGVPYLSFDVLEKPAL